MRVLVHAALLAALVSSVTVAPATAAQPPTTQAKPKTVTLITGDKVTVVRQGPSWDVRIQPAPRIGTQEGFLRHAGPNGVTVIPTSVAPLVSSGQLDRALFDVTRLIDFGYDDEHTTDIPLLVESGPSVAALGNVTRNLPAAGMTAVATPKRDAAKLFELAKTHKIWLNGKAYPSLDQSVPQVGAPGAWQQGHTGVGATIAVLDTGYDATHPDLAGIVKGEKDFTTEGIRDLVGHGTHVAATAAGRGKASGGKYTGVAKGANLLIGKVCETFGCPFDAILEGMQWAADSGADVVNMSLGGGPGDGTDPIETAVNRISAEKGTLFVVAAGNSGQKVSSPAAAAAALAVASVNKKDVHSFFSSIGPRKGDAAVKPDIAAPGEDIVAARAKGTLDDLAVDEFHARLTGTSMATPHVAGAAAILAAQHPDWTGQQIKAALMNSAHPVAAATIYQQGAGRLDVTRAVTQTVTTNVGSLSLGYIKWPGPGPVLSKSLTYKNSGAAPVTLALSTDALFKLSANEVTVPAGGEASVTVSFDPAQAPYAAHGAWLLAKSGATEVRTPVGVYKEPESYDLTVRSIDRAGNVNGPGVALVQSLTDASLAYFPVLPGETVRVPAGRFGVASEVFTEGETSSSTQVPKPEVTVRGDTTVELDARPGVPISTTIDRPDARSVGAFTGQGFKIGDSVGGLIGGGGGNMYATPTTGKYDHFVYFDAAAFEQPLVRLTVTKPEQFEPIVDWAPFSPRIMDTRELSTVDVVRARPEDLAQRDVRGKVAVFTVAAGEAFEFIPRLKAIRDAGATAAFFYFTDSGVGLTEDPPLPTLFPANDADGIRLAKLGTASVKLAGIPASPYHYELSFASVGSVPANLTHAVKTRDLAEVRANYRATAAEADVVPQPSIPGFGALAGVGGPPIPLPTSRTEYYTPDNVSWGTLFAIDRQYFTVSDPAIYKRGQVTTADWNKAVFGPGRAELARSGNKLTATLPLFTDAAQHTGLLAPSDRGDTVLYADGKEIGRSGQPGFGEFTVGGPAQYRLTTEATRTSPDWPLSTKVRAEWTFRDARAGKLPSITLDPRVDNGNYAKAGTYLAIPVRPGKDGVVRKVETSTDDGTTWHSAPLVRVQNQWWALVWNPSAGFVSLRAQASYPDGNGVTQTVIRAYRVK